MADDHRTNLISVFHCYECGRKLRLASKPKPDVEPESDWSISDPTGAEVLYNAVQVYPCRHCIETHTKPAKKLTEALRELGQI